MLVVVLESLHAIGIRTHRNGGVLTISEAADSQALENGMVGERGGRRAVQCHQPRYSEENLMQAGVRGQPPKGMMICGCTAVDTYGRLARFRVRERD